MKVVLLLAVVGVAVVAANPYDGNFKPTFEHAGILSDEEIDYINSVQSSWKAGRNFDPSYASVVKRWMGVDMEDFEKEAESLPRKEFPMDDSPLPDHFDPRDKWTNCSSLHEIRDQGNCGSCWAFGAVEAMTDRICIKSNGKENHHLSAEDMLTCCEECGWGCFGGRITRAWKYYAYHGVVTGGQYNSHQGCQPYQIPSCDHSVGGHLPPCHGYSNTPRCLKICENAYNISYQDDKHYGTPPYFVKGNEDIMRELYTRGPMEAGFFLYSDLLHYKSGVYFHASGKFLGGHAVKVMGWGEENGQKYWLIANSWNKDWGDKGFFKMLRGVDECGLESKMIAAEPDL